MKRDWRIGIRSFLVRSAIPPLSWLYQAVYRGLIGLVRRLMARHRAVRALYLCRGCARQAVLPGLSDIDLMVITDGEDGQDRIRREFALLARLTAGLVDYYPSLVASEATLRQRFASSPAWRYRYLEGRSSWTLLAGRDVLASLPEPTREQRQSACYFELNRWWQTFADRLLVDSGNLDAPLLCNAVCYKAACEVRNVDAALRGEPLPTSREQALRGWDSPLAERLRRTHAERYLRPQPGLAEETCAYLLDYYAALWREFASAPFLPVLPVRSLSLRGSLDVPPDVREHVASLWSGPVRFVSSVLWEANEILALLEGPASVRRLAQTVERHRRARLSRPLHLFLWHGQVGFPLAPRLPMDLHRGLLTPGTTPDVYLQLGLGPVAWTEPTRSFLCDWRHNERWPGCSPAQGQRLDALAESAASGHLCFPVGPS